MQRTDSSQEEKKDGSESGDQMSKIKIFAKNGEENSKDCSGDSVA